ncbi:tryptophan synthase, alpha chain [Virgibacillus subterraneus]|uniref:tryptophan synthase n=1 Tax=Virgibacillus subterraneus TaxID=621109 RepID=A0A1H9AQV7_9BACI|nr:tryptophan synthase subunit alpha [Virgibacillus subterraneus]SEP79039.1 tryptophan synthase, alpha chain [Virgibacillus subterraneus]
MVYVHSKKNNLKLPEVFLTGYFVGKHPSHEESIDLITACVSAGLDAVEIGIPSTDPYLDGDVISHAHATVVEDFRKQEDYFSYLKQLRENINVPVWIMGYYNDLVKDDLYKKLAAAQLADGFVIPDLQQGHFHAMRKEIHPLGAAIFPVVNDGMRDDELCQYIEDTELLYCQLYKGETGKSIANVNSLPLFYQRMRNLTDAKLMGGFGIKDGQLAKNVYHTGYDGVVVGSEIVRLVNEGSREELLRLIKELASAKSRKEE